MDVVRELERRLGTEPVDGSTKVGVDVRVEAQGSAAATSREVDRVTIEALGSRGNVLAACARVEPELRSSVDGPAPGTEVVLRGSEGGAAKHHAAVVRDALAEPRGLRRVGPAAARALLEDDVAVVGAGGGAALERVGSRARRAPLEETAVDHGAEGPAVRGA